jgi:stage II sporulation protein AA (anti-sigma F factor antagonist)
MQEKILQIDITEEIDHDLQERIRTRLDYEIQRFMPRKLILNLDKVTFMDSAGIGLIIGRYKVLKNYGGVMEIQNVNEKIKRVLDMSGIKNIADIKIKEPVKI